MNEKKVACPDKRGHTDTQIGQDDGVSYATPGAPGCSTTDIVRTLPKVGSFIEPSPGTGTFADAVPSGTTAMDVLPLHYMVKQESLAWKLFSSGRPCAVFGSLPLLDRLWHTGALTPYTSGRIDIIFDARTLGRSLKAAPLPPGIMQAPFGKVPNRFIEWGVRIK